MSPLPVSGKRLTNCTVRFSDALLTNCAFLPLFGVRGGTAKVVLLSAATQECWIYEWRPDLVYVPVFGAARVDAPRGLSQRAAVGASLWFLDPQGVTEKGIVTLCGQVPARNAAAVLPNTVVRLRWRRDLACITSVWIKAKNEAKWELGKWNPAWLENAPPLSPAAEKSASLRRGWVLDPLWMR